MEKAAPRLSQVCNHLLPSPVAAAPSPLYVLPEIPQYPSAAQARVANLQPDVVVPISFFDYDAWDKITKPANSIMMRMVNPPPELRADAKNRMKAASKRIMVDTPIYNGRLVKATIKSLLNPGNPRISENPAFH